MPACWTYVRHRLDHVILDFQRITDLSRKLTSGSEAFSKVPSRRVMSDRRQGKPPKWTAIGSRTRHHISFGRACPATCGFVNTTTNRRPPIDPFGNRCWWRIAGSSRPARMGTCHQWMEASWCRATGTIKKTAALKFRGNRQNR